MKITDVKAVQVDHGPGPRPFSDAGYRDQRRVFGYVEVFTDESRVAMSVAAISDEKSRTLGLTPHDGEVTIRSAAVYRMKSACGK